ncbi:putative ankyrin repeat protein RF_0381 [Cydia pomonella]|uniref:putative ankyrin repeat protein RF_0381 n=1 Tax=Cydia pomonella TaxID=82600 RepID=UPI002ADDEFC5|nr:putative ankyrin repeat protein RF_0381 [Cydia pomonella]
MDSDKLNDIFGSDPTRRNCTIFHSIADSDCDDILDRIFNNSEDKAFQHILKLKNNDGKTCLHKVVRSRSGSDADEMISLMKAMGADLNAQDNAGDTVLHKAVKKRDHELVKGLVEMCADKSINNNDGLTAYQIAEQINEEEIMKILLIKEDNSYERSVSPSVPIS